MHKCVHTYGDGGVLNYRTQYKEGLTITTNSLGHQTYYFHDERSLIYKIIDENGGITHQHYNDDEELEVYVSPQGICEKYSYDDYSNLTKVTDANGDSTQYIYDKRQNLISLQTPGRKQVFMQYDKYDHVVMRMLGTEQVQHYEYKGKYLWKITDEKNHSWHFFYNERHHELTQLTYPNELFAQWQYDVRGNMKSERDTTGMWTKYQYDNANNVIKLEEANGNTHQFAYDSSYNITHAQDDTHNITFDYGSLGVLLRHTQNGRRVNFAYDNELQLNRISNERNEYYRFHLDPAGQVISEEGFDGQERVYERDLEGRVTKVTYKMGKPTKWGSLQHLSNLVAFIRLNLFVKIELEKWLNNPLNEVEKPPPKLQQGVLF